MPGAGVAVKALVVSLAPMPKVSLRLPELNSPWLSAKAPKPPAIPAMAPSFIKLLLPVMLPTKLTAAPANVMPCIKVMAAKPASAVANIVPIEMAALIGSFFSP